MIASRLLRRGYLYVLAVGVALGALALATGASASTDSPTIALTSSLSSSDGSLAVMAFGSLTDSTNTFWELFSRSARYWQLVTPPGVADNGGLVASLSSGRSLVVGFLPSRFLTFSPIAFSDTMGSSWSAGSLPSGLVKAPDVMVAKGTSLDALMQTASGPVIETGSALVGWKKETSLGSIRSTPAGRACRPASLSAVARDAHGSLLVGAICERSGGSGLFRLTASSVVSWTPPEQGAIRSTRSAVLRIDSVGGSTEALVLGTSDRARALRVVVASHFASDATLSLAPGEQILSSGVGAAGGFVVVLKRPAKAPTASYERRVGAPWTQLPTLPNGGSVVSIGPGRAPEALVATTSSLVVYRLGPSSGRWSRVQTLAVPVPFGSSG